MKRTEDLNLNLKQLREIEKGLKIRRKYLRRQEASKNCSIEDTEKVKLALSLNYEITSLVIRNVLRLKVQEVEIQDDQATGNRNP